MMVINDFAIISSSKENRTLPPKSRYLPDMTRRASRRALGVPTSDAVTR
jgi:hypothetical protein